MSNPFKAIIAVFAAIPMLAIQANAQINNMTYTFTQVGSDVVISGNGSFYISGLGEPIVLGDPDALGSTNGAFGFDYNSSFLYSVNSVPYWSFSGSVYFFSEGSISDFRPPALFGTNDVGGHTNGFIIGTGDILQLITPQDYQSGDSLNSTITFKNSTLAAWGLKTGDTATFYYADSFGGPPGIGTITLLVAVPEPSALLLVGSVAGAGLVRRRRR